MEGFGSIFVLMFVNLGFQACHMLNVCLNVEVWDDYSGSFNGVYEWDLHEVYNNRPVYYKEDTDHDIVLLSMADGGSNYWVIGTLWYRGTAGYYVHKVFRVESVAYTPDQTTNYWEKYDDNRWKKRYVIIVCQKWVDITTTSSSSTSPWWRSSTSTPPWWRSSTSTLPWWKSSTSTVRWYKPTTTKYPNYQIEEEKDSDAVLIIALAAPFGGLVLLIIIIAASCCVYQRNKTERRTRQPPSTPTEPVQPSTTVSAVTSMEVSNAAMTTTGVSNAAFEIDHLGPQPPHYDQHNFHLDTLGLFPQPGNFPQPGQGKLHAVSPHGAAAQSAIQRDVGQDAEPSAPWLEDDFMLKDLPPSYSEVVGESPFLDP